MNVIFVIISLILYTIAPDEYSYSHCLLAHSVFLINAITLIMRDGKRELVGFNLLFAISFYFVNFVYPIFVYQTVPDYSLFRFPFNANVITSSTSMSCVAFSLYSLAYSMNVKKNLSVNSRELYLSKGILQLILFMTISLFLVFMGIGGLRYYSEIYQQGIRTTSPIIQYFIVILNPLIILTCLMIFFTKNKNIIRNIFIFSLFVAFILMLAGTRTLPLSILILLFIYIVKTKKLSRLAIYICIILGVFVMSVVGTLRSGSADWTEYSGQWFGFMEDLIINNRNLYVVYDYVTDYGILWGLPFLGPLLSVIPMLQSVIMNTFGIPYYLMSSPDFITFMEFGNYPPLGLGTNIVGDVYLSFGFIGVLLAFYFLGFFIAEVRNRMWAGKIYASIIYYIMVSESIYMCRSTYLSCFRTLIWAILIIYIMTRFTSKPVTKSVPKFN